MSAEIKPVKVPFLKNLANLPIEKSSNYHVFSCYVNKDAQEDKTDDLFGMIFFLGSYSDKNQADSKAKEIIEKTGAPSVVVWEYAKPFIISPNSDKYNTDCKKTDIKVDVSGKIMEHDDKEYLKDVKKFEDRKKLETEIEKEISDEFDPEHIEHFKINAFTAVKLKAKLQFLEKELKSTREAFEKRKNNVRQHYAKHPENEERLLSYFKNKLLSRGEEQIYEAFSNGYKDIRDELLGLESKAE